ncbi:DUF2075 domain-containing protein [Intrasporangium mesophilum]
MSALLRHTADGFAVVEAGLEEMLARQMLHQTGQRPSPGERTSWRMSLPVLAADLVGAGRGGVEMLIEYRLPLTSKRADVVLAGMSSRTGEPAYLVVEMKQWSEAHRYEDSDVLVTVPSYGKRPVSHPLDQVLGYCEYLTDFVATLSQHDRQVAGVAYLHNASDGGVRDLLSGQFDTRVRMFTGQRRGEWVAFLQSFFAAGDGAAAADELLSSRVAPSKQLMRLAAEEVQKREMFVLLDEQRDAYNTVLHAVARAREGNTKTAVVVEGGPGSGKSVIALSLLGELARQGRTVVHATGSQSFTTTLRKVAARGAPRVRRAFQYFNSFMAASPNEIECLIMDEAHRIRETSANRFTRASLRSGRPQIDELLSAARVPVFLLDENQVVRPGEMGTVRDITAAAQERGIAVTHIDLDAQFRCGGSLEFVDWVERLLELRPRGPRPWQDEEHGYAVELMDSPEELEGWLSSRRAEGYGARITAGYCWRWSDPRQDGSLVNDVKVGDWSRPWNVKGDRATGGAPPSALWASDPAGFGQVGCIYTAQGFEYDYGGVILGPDFVRRGDRWVADQSASKDPVLTRRGQVTESDFDRLVRNVYKVLLTRGMLGVGIYSTDRETREFIARFV